MPNQEQTTPMRAEAHVQQISRVTLDDLNQAPINLEAGQFGREALLIDISDKERASFDTTTEHYSGGAHALDYRGGTPVFSVVTGGRLPEQQVTYTVMSETSDTGPTGALHVIGRNAAGEQIDFAELGSAEVRANTVLLGREYKGGQITGSDGRMIPPEVSRRAIGIGYVYDAQSKNTMIEVRDNATNKNTQVRGAQYQDPEQAPQSARRQEKAGKFAGKSILSKLGVVR